MCPLSVYVSHVMKPFAYCRVPHSIIAHHRQNALILTPMYTLCSLQNPCYLMLACRHRMQTTYTLSCYPVISFRVLHGVKVFDGLHHGVPCVFALQKPIVVLFTGLLIG